MTNAMLNQSQAPPRADEPTERDLQHLVVGLAAAAGPRCRTVLAVGSVGRMQRERFAARAVRPEDYDVIVIIDSSSDLARLAVRRRLDAWLRSEATEFAVPVSVGVLRASALPRLPFTLFNYEMRHAYRLLTGRDPGGLLPPFPHEALPLVEGTRLLLNRGVLLWGDVARFASCMVPDEDVTARLRKVVLAIGDAVLIANGAYHWSYAGRLSAAACCTDLASIGDGSLGRRYTSALESKLAGDAPATPPAATREQLPAVLGLHEAAYRLVEERRLGRPLGSWTAYASGDIAYPPELQSSAARRVYKLCRSFGLPRGLGFYRQHLLHVPETVLLRAFPLLAYTNAADAALLRRTLNWSTPEGVTRQEIWERFHAIWVVEH